MKFIYLGDRSKARTNVITIAYKLEPHNVARFGIAFSNKNDLYSKEFGKSLAIERYEQPHRHFIDKTKGSYFAILESLEEIEMPSWAYDMIEKELLTFDE